MAKGTLQFLRDVRTEAQKVTWPSRKETITTTIVVLIMITIISAILLVADGVISASVKFILALGA